MHKSRMLLLSLFDDELQIDIASLRSGIGKTGVHFRFYKKHEFYKLTKAQKDELVEWRLTPEGKTLG